MKRELALSAVAILISVLLSSPSVAQTAPKPADAKPAPAPIVAVEPATLDQASLDDAILMASTPQERAALIRRCSGPPPRFQQTAHTKELPAPASEPAAFE